MRNKTKRLLTIRKLIESELISSQEELLFRLKEMNVEATQSTLSRDLKFMKVAKIPHKEVFKMNNGKKKFRLLSPTPY